MPSSRWFNGNVNGKTEGAFLRKAFIHFLPRYLKSLVRPNRTREPQKVQALYDAERGSELDRFKQAPCDFETYVFGPAEDTDFVLVNDSISFNSLRSARKKVVEQFETHLKPYLEKDRGILVEFGCGFGRNLLYLKKKYPHITFIGLELSPESVKLCQEAARHYGLDVQFYQANVCEKLPELPKGIAVCFSVHALEQMPRIFQHAVTNMLNLAQHEVFFFEPVHELYPSNLRGIVSHWRTRCIDRLSGLKNYLVRSNCKIRLMQRLQCGDNPLNETCVISVTN